MKVYVLVKRMLDDFGMGNIEVYVESELVHAQSMMKTDFEMETENTISREEVEEDGWEFNEIDDMSATLKAYGSDFGLKWQIFEREIY